MKLYGKKYGRALWLNLVVLILAMSGIYGVNALTVRKVVLTVAVSLVFASIAYVVRGRSENCGNSAAQR